MDEFIKKGDKYFRNNSDGTLTQVTPTKDEYFTWVLPDGKKVRSLKKYKISFTQPKLEESFLSKLGRWFTDISLQGGDPADVAVKRAAGIEKDKDGNWTQNPYTPGATQLRDNLAVISATALPSALMYKAPSAAVALTPLTVMGSVGLLPWWQTMIGNFAGSMATGMAADEISRRTTGKSIGQNVRSAVASSGDTGEMFADYLIPEFAWEFANPFYMVNPTKTITNIDKYGKHLYLLVRNINFLLPTSTNNYYRVITNLTDDLASNAIADANLTGVIRGNPKGTLTSSGVREHYIGPYFTSGKPFKPALDRHSKVIVAEPNSELLWLEIGPHETILKETKGTGLFTPLYKGIPNQSPTNFFYYYERGNGPISKYFWFKRKFNPQNNIYYNSAGNYFNKDKYLLDGLWNIPTILKELQEGLSKAKNYFSSDLRKLIDAKNLEEAKQLGFTNFDINRNSAYRVSQPLNSKTIANPNVDWYARITSPGINPLDDLFEINLVSPDIENSTFHEILHRGSLGIAEPPRVGESFEAFRARVKDTNAFYKTKVESFLKPRKEIPDNLKESYDYISESMETAANYFEAGLRLGIPEGAPYPGDEKVLEIIKTSQTDPRMISKLNLLTFARTDSKGLLNLWKALTGTLFILPLIINGTNNNSSLKK